MHHRPALLGGVSILALHPCAGNTRAIFVLTVTTPKLPEQVSMTIYCRDGGRCVLCGSTKKISVDHLTARSWGGDELDPTNLVTACKLCNDAKGNMDLVAFAGMIERYAPHLPSLERFGTNPRAADITNRVNAHRLSPLNPTATEAALEIIRENRRDK